MLAARTGADRLPAHTISFLGGVEHLELFFQVEQSMVLRSISKEILAVVGTGPVNVETQVFRQQLVHRSCLHHVDGAGM